MRAGICDMVAVARIINATLVVPELDKNSFWQDTNVFDEDYFISSLASDVKIVRKLPKDMSGVTKAVKHFRSWSGMDYYKEEISSLWEDYKVCNLHLLCTTRLLKLVKKSSTCSYLIVLSLNCS
ncbi:unnamed protein product [Linum tenue]|uniref:O-fucosyltransferase family protein n=1 Tax=Linum tenue TaxID=586396 RepID=A0AAV0QUR2_9ROSI|nr:unnamed protein product [Linum tenue]